MNWSRKNVWKWFWVERVIFGDFDRKMDSLWFLVEKKFESDFESKSVWKIISAEKVIFGWKIDCQWF